MSIANPVIFITASIYHRLNIIRDHSLYCIILSSLSHLHAKNHITIYAFVLMPNHIHIVWREHHQTGNNKERPKAAFFKFTAHQFLKHLKQNSPGELKYFRVNKSDRNHQFWNRYPLEIEVYNDKMFEQKLNYIHGNPTQSHWQLVDHEIDYKYSSIRFYEQGTDEFGFLTNYFLEE